MTTNLRSEGGSSEEPSLYCYDIAESQRVEVRPNNNIRLCNCGHCIEMPIEKWIRAAIEGLPESKHIDAMLAAISWYFGPSDVLKVRKRYLEIVNEKEPKK